MKKGMLLTTAALTMATASAFHYFSDLAVARKRPYAPSFVKRQERKEMDDDIFEDTVEQAKAEIKRHTSQQWTLTSFDGLQLYGRAFVPKKPKRIILFMHGWRSHWQKDFGILARPLLDEDCLIFFADQRSHGKSQGEYITYGHFEADDCRGWVAAIHQRYPALPIYLWGASMGATTVLYAAAEPLPPAVKGVIADCGFTSAEEEIEHLVAQKLSHGSGALTAVYRHNIKRRCGFDIASKNTVDTLYHTTLPILFFHGGDDNFVPLWMSEANYIAAQGEKSLTIIDGAAHCKSFYVDFDTCFSAVLRFFDAHDEMK